MAPANGMKNLKYFSDYSFDKMFGVEVDN